MRTFYPILTILVLLAILSGCLLTKGRFTEDGSMWVWKKNPSGRYNNHNPLQTDKATQWVKTVGNISSLRKIKVEVFSKSWDTYEINDTGVFISNGNLFKGQEKERYKSAKTMGRQIGVSDTLLTAIIKDFDKLGLNRFYRENEVLIFNTELYMNSRKGYFYFTDSLVTENIKKGDTLLFPKSAEFKNFRVSSAAKFLILHKHSGNWLEWEGL